MRLLALGFIVAAVVCITLTIGIQSSTSSAPFEDRASLYEALSKHHRVFGEPLAPRESQADRKRDSRNAKQKLAFSWMGSTARTATDCRSHNMQYSCQGARG